MIKSSEKIRRMKKESDNKLVMVTAYDFCFGQIMQEAGVDLILVGDSSANVVLGRKTTRDIGMEEMKIFVEAVCNGASQTHVVADMPYKSDETPDLALKNASTFLSKGASSVKVEGVKLEVTKHLIHHDIPVMGHLGLLPQTATSLKQVGKSKSERTEILTAAEKLCEIGIFALILEHIDYDLAAEITLKVPVPTIGIGAGAKVDGQVLVMHDLLGLNAGNLPPFAKSYSGMRKMGTEAVNQWGRDVREGRFPQILEKTSDSTFSYRKP